MDLIAIGELIKKKQNLTSVNCRWKGDDHFWGLWTATSLVALSSAWNKSFSFWDGRVSFGSDAILTWRRPNVFILKLFNRPVDRCRLNLTAMAVAMSWIEFVKVLEMVFYCLTASFGELFFLSVLILRLLFRLICLFLLMKFGSVLPSSSFFLPPTVFFFQKNGHSKLTSNCSQKLRFFRGFFRILCHSCLRHCTSNCLFLNQRFFQNSEGFFKIIPGFLRLLGILFSLHLFSSSS